MATKGTKTVMRYPRLVALMGGALLAAPLLASHYHPDRFAGRAGTYYKVVWGVDSLSVKWGESGEVIRFTHRVWDADRARVLNDKTFEPSLVDPQAGVKLVVPSLENVGQLRQSAPPQDGKSYWMVFSNKGRLVKRGDHVSLVIGPFRADGLVVDCDRCTTMTSIIPVLLALLP